MAAVVMWTIAGIAGAVAIALGFVLWRRRRAGSERWKTQDHLTAIGIAAAVLASLLTSIAAHATSSGEPADVTAYRLQVRAACVSLDENAAVIPPPDERGNVQRDALVTSLHHAIDASVGILGGLWERPVPDELQAAVADATESGNVWLYVSRGLVNELAERLPAVLSDADALVQVAQLDQQNGPNVARFLSAMATLAGQTCVESSG
jgi:hypothetical protein